MVATRGDLIKVHYKGWKQRWDEWLPADGSRVRPLPSGYESKRGLALTLAAPAASSRALCQAPPSADSAATAAATTDARTASSAATKAAAVAVAAAKKASELPPGSEGHTRALEEVAAAAAAAAAIAKAQAKAAEKAALAAGAHAAAVAEASSSQAKFKPTASGRGGQGRGRGGRSQGRSRGSRARGQGGVREDAVGPLEAPVRRGMSDGDLVRAENESIDDGDYERCGTFGCVLANKHSGLHIFPEVGMRRRGEAPSCKRPRLGD